MISIAKNRFIEKVRGVGGGGGKGQLRLSPSGYWAVVPCAEVVKHRSGDEAVISLLYYKKSRSRLSFN